MLVDTTPVTGDDGRVTAVVEISSNLAPVRDLRAQMASLGLVVGSVSQDLKGLLTGVDGGLYLVHSGIKKEDPARVARGLEMVRRNVDRIRSQALDVLYYAKDREPVPEMVEVGAIVEEVSAGAARRADEHGVDLQCEIHPSAGTFEVDAGAVRALLANLLDHAIDACRMDPSRPDHLVRIRADGSGVAVHVTVSDTGLALDREARERALAPFVSEADDTALGLYVAHKIARAHGGRIDVASDQARGARFTVTLPRRPASRGPT